MTEDMMVSLFKENDPRSAVLSITPVSGGLMHRMYKVDTEKGSFAVKHLNPDIIKRPGAADRFRNAESLETLLDAAGIPIVPAMTVNGRKMQEFGGEFFYIFPWQNGAITDWRHISARQCRAAGSIQGRIHAIRSERTESAEQGSDPIDWERLIKAAAGKNEQISALIESNKELLAAAQGKLQAARSALPGIDCIVDEDMDPKNVMWDNGEPKVIDLERLEMGNPVSSALQLSLKWAGITTCELSLDNMKAFFDGYLEEYDNGFRDYSAVFGLAYTWIEWLEYSIKRAIGESMDENEFESVMTDAKHTIGRLRYIFSREPIIIQTLDSWFKRK